MRKLRASEKIDYTHEHMFSGCNIDQCSMRITVYHAYS